MRLKIERRYSDDGEWTSVGIIDPETEYRRSEHPVGSAFCKRGEVGDILTLHDGWRYTLIPDAVKHRMIRATITHASGRVSNTEYPDQPSAMPFGVDINGFFRGYVGSSITLERDGVSWRYELIEVEDES